MAWSKIIQDAPLVTFPSDSLLNLGARASIFHLLANTRPNAEGVTGALGVSGLSSDSYGGMVFGIQIYGCLMEYYHLLQTISKAL